MNKIWKEKIPIITQEQINRTSASIWIEGQIVWADWILKPLEIKPLELDYPNRKLEGKTSPEKPLSKHTQANPSNINEVLEDTGLADKTVILTHIPLDLSQDDSELNEDKF